MIPTEGDAGVGGWAFIKTLSDGRDVHPVASVTVKVYVPEGSNEIIVVLPVAEIVTPPGLRVNVPGTFGGQPV